MVTAARPSARVPARIVRVEPVMGTTVTIDVRRPLVEPSAINEAIAWFHDVDRRFSMFRPDSEASRVAAGSLGLDDASPDVRAMVTLAETVRERSDGYFDARRHRPDGRLDPTGIVKGWSVDEAISLLRLAGARNVQVVAGGDLVAAGEASPGALGGSGSGTPRPMTASPPSSRSPTSPSRPPASMSAAATSAIRTPAG